MLPVFSPLPFLFLLRGSQGVSENEFPTFVGTHKSLLKATGRRRGLNDLYDSFGFDDPYHRTHGNRKRGKPYQRTPLKELFLEGGSDGGFPG